MIHIKYCERCHEAFDIATNFAWCPRCRQLNEGSKEDVEGNT